MDKVQVIKHIIMHLRQEHSEMPFRALPIVQR
jgi:hypothetical protein